MAVPPSRISPSGPLAPSSGASGIQSTSNEGAGEGVALPLVGTDAPFKSLEAGMNVSITPTADSLIIAATPGGPTGSNSVVNESGVPGANVSDALDNLQTDIDNIGTDDVINDSGVPGASCSDALDNLAGDIGTNASNIATNTSNIATNTGDISTLTGQVNSNTSAITTLQSDKLETTSNAGGVGLALPKVGTDAPFKGLTAGANITITPGANSIEIAAASAPTAPVDSVAGSNGITPASPTTGAVVLSGAGLLAELDSPGATGEPLTMVKSGQNGQIKKIIAGANITLTPAADSLTIAAAGGGGGSGLLGQEIYPAALIQTGKFFGSQPDGVFRSLGFIASGAYTVNRLAIYIVQTGSGTLNLGLYDQNGNLLAGSTDGFKAPIVGTNIFTIPNTVLTGMQRHYIGVCSRLNGSQFGTWVGGLTSSPTPHLFIEDVNGNAGATMRATFNINSGQLPAPGDRQWGIAGFL